MCGVFHKCALVSPRLSAAVKYVVGLCGNTSPWNSPIPLELVRVRHIPPAPSSVIPVRFFLLSTNIWFNPLVSCSDTDQRWGAGIWPGPLLHTKALRLWPGEGLHPTRTHLGQVGSDCFFFHPSYYSHGCAMCPGFAQSPAEDEKNSGRALVTLCKYQLISQPFGPSAPFSDNQWLWLKWRSQPLCMQPHLLVVCLCLKKVGRTAKLTK